MSKLILSASFLLAVVLGPWLAVAQGPVEGKEYELMPIDRMTRKAVRDHGGGSICGKYMFMDNKVAQPSPGKYATVLFQYVNSSNSVDIYLISWDLFIVLVNNSRKVPTAAYAKRWGSDDEMPFHWVIELSAKHLREMQACLPKPSKLPQ